jgi:hypothetical protein
MARRWTSEDEEDGDDWKRGVRPDEAFSRDSEESPVAEDLEGPGEADRHLTDPGASFSVECPHCGATIDEGYEKCPNCRNWITDEDRSISEMERARRRWRIIVVILLLFSFLACCGYLWWLR